MQRKYIFAKKGRPAGNFKTPGGRKAYQTTKGTAYLLS